MGEIRGEKLCGVKSGEGRQEIAEGGGAKGDIREERREGVRSERNIKGEVIGDWAEEGWKISGKYKRGAVRVRKSVRKK